jgi:hypothetical protein
MNLDWLYETAGIYEGSSKLLEENIREIEILEEKVETEGASIEKLEKMLDAAKRGLGLANKLKPGDKKSHLSRIMSNINVIRNALNRLVKAL